MQQHDPPSITETGCSNMTPLYYRNRMQQHDTPSITETGCSNMTPLSLPVHSPKQDDNNKTKE